MFEAIKNDLLNDSPDANSTYRSIFQILIVCLITFLVYLNTLGNGFVIDDYTYILQWNESHNIKNSLDIIINHPWPKDFAKIEYRPIKATLQIIDYQLFKENPFGYHLQSLIIHLLATIFVFLIIKKIIGKQSVAFIASLIFGVHPIHTEAVDFLTASSDTFSMLLFFISFYLYIYSTNDVGRNKLYITLSIIVAVVAYFGYELALTLPFILILYDICFKKIDKNNLKTKIKYYSIYLGGALGFFLIRLRFIGELNTSKYFADSFYLTMLTMTKAVIRYFELMIFPLNLSINQILPGNIESLLNVFDNSEAIRAQSIFDPVIIANIIIIFGLISLAIYFFKGKPIITFCFFWVFITLLPVLNIIPIRQVMAERYFYIPSFSIILLFSISFYYLYHFKYQNKYREIAKNLLIIIFIILVALLSIRTIIRNQDWKDLASIWASVAKQSIGGALGNYYLGIMHFQKDDFNSAINYFNKAIEEKNRYKAAYYFLTLSYIDIQNYNMAKRSFTRLSQIVSPEEKPKIEEIKKILTNISLATSSDNKIYSNNLFSLTYPNLLNFNEINNEINITEKDSAFSIKINYLITDLNPNDYINKETSNYGNLINRGLAQAPNVDYAYVKVWQDNGTQKMQFFLFKNNLVLKILAWPSDSSEMKTFNSIIASIKFF